MRDGREGIRQFVLTYIELIGGNIEEVDDDVFRVELETEQAAELEGGPVNLGLGWQNSNRHVTYYFTFSSEVAAAEAEVELISPGSHRLQQVIYSVRRLGRATRVWLPASLCVRGMNWQPARILYRPFFLFLIRLDSGPQPSELVKVAVDRVEQFPLRHLAELATGFPLSRGAPPSHEETEPPAISFEKAFAVAFEDVLRRLEESEATWAREARANLEAERDRLIAFYAERERDGESAQAEREQRLQELDRLKPRVLVRVQGVVDLLIPVASKDGTCRYLPLEMGL